MLENTTQAATYWVILPTYCEAENLPVIVNKLLSLDLDLDLLVVDDSSPDGTGEIADKMSEVDGRVHVLHRQRAGLGAAYLAGFEYALRAGADFVITMDSDSSHDPAALPRMISEADEAGCVVGSRYTPGGEIKNWPRQRKALSAAANEFVRVLFHMPVRDCTSGYRIYRRSVVQDIVHARPRSQGYSFLVEALRFAVMGPLPVKESPICFVERVAGNSKMGLREIVFGARDLIRLRLRMLTNPPTAASNDQRKEAEEAQEGRL